MDDSIAPTPPPSEERLLDAEEIEKVAATLKRPTARMQLESLAKKLRKEAAGLKALEAVGAGNSAPVVSDRSSTSAKDGGNDEAKPHQTTTTTSRMQEEEEVTASAAAPNQRAVASPLPAPVLVASSTITTTSSSSQKYTTIDRFAFDAGGYSDRFVTLYISLPGVGDGVPKDHITCTFTKESFDLIIRDWNGKSYRLFKDHLEKDIEPEKSKYIVKADKIVIKLQKINGEYGSYDYWSKLTDPKRVDKKKAKKNTSSDPAASINDLMKDMYESGDDNMKKMIAETMMKQRNGELNKATDPLGDGDYGMGM